MEIKLQCPIKQGIMSQKWYANNTNLHSLQEFFWCQSQGFGVNPDTYAWLGIKGHNGLDLTYENGTEVFASHDGTAEFASDSSKGLGVTITDNEKKTIYWHLKDAIKPLGSVWTVKQGELIGWGDTTGFSTGPHLHYGLKLLDINGNVLNRDNGYDGAVDPTLYIVWWNNMTEQEVKQLQALEGYSDPEGVAYWTGKPLGEYLKARLPDKIKTINESL